MALAVLNPGERQDPAAPKQATAGELAERAVDDRYKDVRDTESAEQAAYIQSYKHQRAGIKHEYQRGKAVLEKDRRRGESEAEELLQKERDKLERRYHLEQLAKSEDPRAERFQRRVDRTFDTLENRAERGLRKSYRERRDALRAERDQSLKRLSGELRRARRGG